MKINYISMTVSILLLAATLLKAQNTYVPDDNFEQALIDLGYGSGELTLSEQSLNADKNNPHVLSVQNKFWKKSDKEITQNLKSQTTISNENWTINKNGSKWIGTNHGLAVLNENKATSGIPISEYNCLVDLYNSTLGEDWTNNTNWLDTVKSSVGDWFGITVENGHVTRIELSNNNLQEGVFEYPLQLPELKVIDLSGNKLSDANFYSLDSLSNLTGLHIENNNFNFKHINDIQNLPFYNNFSDNFSYSPQGKIDFSEEFVLNPGDILEMDINTSYMSLGDFFQWYKDDLPIDGATNYFYDKTNVTLNDSGTYYVKITNPKVAELTLQSHNKHVTVKDLVGGVPRSEYEALVSLYNTTNGNNWTNNSNWLDTINHAVADWFGVTVTNGNITVIDLYNNNLYGEISISLGNLSKLETLGLNRNRLYGPIPVSFKDLTELQILALEYNSLGPVFIDGDVNPERAIPDELSELESLLFLSIKSNKFFFNDIETVQSWGLTNFIYDYQYPFNVTNQSILLEPGADFTLKLENYLAGEHDFYQWTKNGNPISGANDSILVIGNVQLSDEAVYRCQITNSLVENLTILSDPVSVEVNNIHGAGVSLSEYRALEKFYTLNGGDNWKYKENWLDTITCTVAEWAGILVRDGHVRKLTLDSVNVAGALPIELKGLTYLEGLSLFDNNISGNLPLWMGELTSLEYLSLGNNNLTGGLPSDLGQLTNLKYLEISGNRLDGSIPPEIGNATNLEAIFLDKNLLSGAIPEELGNLNNLRHLNLEQNNLTGTIPATLGNLTNLRTLDLSHNQLVGPLPVELENLENICRFDIDNNLIGETDLNKNATLNKGTPIDNDRQIPDELAGLIQMDTLYLGGNKLQFNDIEAIFSWENFDSFNEFIYSPQDSIGITKTENKFTGENVTLSIDNYFAGPSDRYQWYKNGSSIPGATSALLNLDALQISDAGKYYCKITNPVATDLTLYSRKITLKVSEAIKGSGVPLSEYEALVAIYNSTNGLGWTNHENWLDTVNHSVGEWFGITVKENHVTGFEMPNNNLSQFPQYLNHLPELITINLSAGNFENSVSDFENLSKLDTLNLSGNKFTFKDLAEITDWTNYDNFKTNFIYSPQADVGEEMTYIFHIDDTMKLKIKFYESEINDHFEWHKNQTIIPESDFEIFKKLVTYDDNRTDFYCKITNQTLPELTLQSELIHIEVTNSIVDSFLLFDLTIEYPQLQTIWDYEVPFSKWPGVTFEKGKVTALNLSGLNLEGDFSSYFTDFDSLRRLDLSNNNLFGEFPGNEAANNSTVKSNGSNNQILQYLDISNNNFVFAGLEPAFDFFQTIDTFIYAPQSMVGLPFDTTIFKNQPVTFEIANYTPGSFDRYSWSKDGAEIAGADELAFVIQNAALADSGYYTCTITNLLFPELTLLSDTSRLNVLIPVGIDDFNNAHFNIYPNPAEKQVFVETGNTLVDLKIFDIAGTLFFEEKNFTSGWINIEPFTRGIYMVRITRQNSETVTKKLIFK